MVERADGGMGEVLTGEQWCQAVEAEVRRIARETEFNYAEQHLDGVPVLDAAQRLIRAMAFNRQDDHALLRMPTLDIPHRHYVESIVSACNRKWALYCVDLPGAFFWVAEYVVATDSALVLFRFNARDVAIQCLSDLASSALAYGLPEADKIATQWNRRPRAAA